MDLAPGALDGVVVLERAGRICTAASASLLARLGARVLRIELPDEASRLSAASFAEAMLRTGGKERVPLTPGSPDFASTWRRLLAAADVLIFDPPDTDEADHGILQEILADRPADKVICALSPAGLAGSDLPLDAGDPLIQAVGGSMAVTGHEGGRPEFVRLPVAEMSAAVVATSAMLAALRVRERDGAGQLIDISLIEIVADQLRTHVATAMDGQPHEFRMGCRHPLCYPWNVYRARDGWVLICSASDVQWRGILDVIGHPELKTDERFASTPLRRGRADEVDALLQAWAGEHSIAEVVAAISAIAVPVGPALSIPQVVADPVLVAQGTVLKTADTADGPAYLLGNALRLSRTPLRPATAPGGDHPPSEIAPRPRRSRAGERDLRPPLDGVRVIELSRYAAGPIAGLVLAALGAEVIKVEPPQGEDCRGWEPNFAGVSGYFVNYNAGKRSVVLDLRQAAAREQLGALIAGADVVLQNQRPGVLEGMGFGAAAVTAANPRVVYCSVSGFGLEGPQLAALDTVIQGRVGLTALIGDGRMPCRMGYSIADQLSGHFAATGILAALAERDRSGRGQIVDTAMCDAIAWLTQLTWPDGAPAIGPTSQWPASDGWIVAQADPDAVIAALGSEATAARSRAALVRSLTACGITAAPVLEPEEVFVQPVIRQRASLSHIVTGRTAAGTEAMAPLLVVPSGLTSTPVLRPARLRGLGEDNAACLAPP